MARPEASLSSAALIPLFVFPHGPNFPRSYGRMYQAFQKLVMVYETEPDNFPRLMELMQDVSVEEGRTDGREWTAKEWAHRRGARSRASCTSIHHHPPSPSHPLRPLHPSIPPPPFPP
jgi:hypothetical protein